MDFVCHLLQPQKKSEVGPYVRFYSSYSSIIATSKRGRGDLNYDNFNDVIRFLKRSPKSQKNVQLFDELLNLLC